jgi:hypothetical protein
MEPTDAKASAFLRAVWRYYAKTFRRRLQPFELVIIAHALALAIVERFDVAEGPSTPLQMVARDNHLVPFHAKPHLIDTARKPLRQVANELAEAVCYRDSRRQPGLLAAIASDGMRGEVFDQAAATLKYLRVAGDDPRARNEDSVTNDRLVIEALARHWLKAAIKHADKVGKAEFECHGINDSKASEWIAANGDGAHLSHTEVRYRRIHRSERIMDSLHRDFPDQWSAKRRPIDDGPASVNDNKARLTLAAAA